MKRNIRRRSGLNLFSLLVVEREPIFRHALHSLLERWGIRALALGAWEEVEQHYRRGRPDAVLLDLASEPAEERRGLHNLVRDRFPDARVVVLSGNDPGRMAQYILDGASVVVPRREVSAEQLRRMLELAVPGRSRNGTPPLSCNELRLLGWVGAGFDDLTIATVLQVPPGIIRGGVSRIRRKLRRDSRGALVDLARRAGLTLTPR